MKADWVLRIELSRFFENKSELRVRVKKDVLADTILRGVYDSSLQKEFTKGEILRAEKVGLIVKKSISVGRSHRTVWGWTDKPCVYQPTWYKRWYGKVKNFLAERLTS